VEYYTTYPKTPEKRAGNPNFRLDMRAPEGTPFGVTSLPVALSIMCNDTFCTIVVVQNVQVAHAHAITSVIFYQGRFRWRNFRLRLRTRSLPVAPPQMWLELCPYSTIVLQSNYKSCLDILFNFSLSRVRLFRQSITLNSLQRTTIQKIIDLWIIA
jgi:hypothetical protein